MEVGWGDGTCAESEKGKKKKEAPLRARVAKRKKKRRKFSSCVSRLPFLSHFFISRHFQEGGAFSFLRSLLFGSRAGACSKGPESNYCGMQERAGDGGRVGFACLCVSHIDPSFFFFLAAAAACGRASERSAGRACRAGSSSSELRRSQARDEERAPVAPVLSVYTGPLFERTASSSPPSLSRLSPRAISSLAPVDLLLCAPSASA